MRILFFTYDLPYPLDSGGKIRSFYLIKELSKKHQVHLFSFYRTKDQFQHLNILKKYCADIKTFQRRRRNSLRNIFYLPLFPFPAALYYDLSIKQHVLDYSRRQPLDIVHLESFYTSVYLNNQIHTPQIIGTENIEWQIYKNYVHMQKNPLGRGFLQLEINRIKNFEEKSWKTADSCLAVSAENKEYIKEKSGKNCYLIPNGVDFHKFNISRDSKQEIKNILFVGNLKYIQNQDAAVWLIDDIWPIIKSDQKIKLIIVGQETDSLKSRVKDKNIKILGYLANIEDAYRLADLVVAPIRIGSGTQFKILEAMVSGLPVVTTSLGAEGIRHDGKQWAMIADSAEKFADGILELLANKDLYEKLAQNAREIIKKYYTWSRIAKDLEKAYEETVNNYR